jgi:prevent-host-death family protein
MDVGIHELKAKLSQYVDRAASGEVIRVTDRGVLRAVLMALPATDRVEQGIREGWVRPPLRTGSPAPPDPVTPPPELTTTEILDDDRGV